MTAATSKRRTIAANKHVYLYDSRQPSHHIRLCRKQADFQDHPAASSCKITMYINTQSSDRGRTKCVLLHRLYSLSARHDFRLSLTTLLLILCTHSLPHILTATAVSLQTAGPSETRLILVSRSGAAGVRFWFGYLLFCLINSSAKDKKTCDTARSTGPPYEIYTHTCFELTPSRLHECLGQKNKGAHDVLSCQ